VRYLVSKAASYRTVAPAATPRSEPTPISATVSSEETKPISTTHGGGWLTVTSVGQQSPSTRRVVPALTVHWRERDILRTLGYALPTALHARVLTVVPTTYFEPPRMLRQTTHKRFREEVAAIANATSEELVTVLSSRDYNPGVRPEPLRWLYNTITYNPTLMGQNMLEIADNGDRSPSQEDLTASMSGYRADAESATFIAKEVNSDVYDPSKPGLEGTIANLVHRGQSISDTAHFSRRRRTEAVVSLQPQATRKSARHVPRVAQLRAR
jgi:hypothetical protein